MNLSKLTALKQSLGIHELKIMCTGEMDVDWRTLEELQLTEDGRSLKKTEDSKILKLAESLLRFGIVNNLQIWVDCAENYFCFDAHHRKKALKVLEEIGVKIPSLPATRCLAESKIEAKKLLLIKESRSSWVDLEVVEDYTREVELELEIAADIIDLPEFDWSEIDSTNIHDTIPKFTPTLPTSAEPGLMSINFIVSKMQFDLVMTALKEEYANESVDPAGVNENKNGNALYTICRQYLENGARRR